MKRTIGGLVLAVVLFGVAAACWQEARRVRRAAMAHEHLATLQYGSTEAIDPPAWIWRQLGWLTGAQAGDVERHGSTVTYWLARYEGLADRTSATGPEASTDPAVLFVSANALFRSQPAPGADRRATIDRLDGVIQAYADVLRRDPAFADAAYNYEYVSRLRDSLAKPGPGKPAPKDRKTPPEDAGGDLPAGPTVHGRPGAPPEGTVMSEFKTITPMRYDEREEQMKPGRGREFRRKG
jgi:hypothetical protein